MTRPIGVFDSGVGGLTVVRELRRRLPGEDLVYLGDTARVPYGSKSPETVLRYSRACARFLLSHEVKLLVVACNTASAAALPRLADELPVPVLGAVEPGAREAAAATRSGHIGVIGTLGTIRSGAYVTAIRAAAPGSVVSGLPCPLLVPLAEEGWTEGEIARAVARRYLGELRASDASIDTLVLGCTHYPLLGPLLEQVTCELFGRAVKLVDSACAMAREAAEILRARSALSAPGRGGQARFYVTDTARLSELGPRFFGAPLGEVAETDLAL